MPESPWRNCHARLQTTFRPLPPAPISRLTRLPTHRFKCGCGGCRFIVSAAPQIGEAPGIRGGEFPRKAFEASAYARHQRHVRGAQWALLLFHRCRRVAFPPHGGADCRRPRCWKSGYEAAPACVRPLYFLSYSFAPLALPPRLGHSLLSQPSRTSTRIPAAGRGHQRHHHGYQFFRRDRRERSHVRRQSRCLHVVNTPTQITATSPAGTGRLTSR